MWEVLVIRWYGLSHRIPACLGEFFQVDSARIGLLGIDLALGCYRCPGRRALERVCQFLQFGVRAALEYILTALQCVINAIKPSERRVDPLVELDLPLYGLRLTTDTSAQQADAQ